MTLNVVGKGNMWVWLGLWFKYRLIQEALIELYPGNYYILKDFSKTEFIEKFVRVFITDIVISNVYSFCERLKATDRN